MNRLAQSLGGCEVWRIRPAALYLAAHLRPRTVLDYGCGDGAWLSVFAELGIPTIGIDRTDRVRNGIGVFVQHDLRKPLPPVFDNGMVGVRVKEPSLALCLEVAEHLPETSARDLVSMLARHSAVAFSAAVPGQGGLGHVNEQWQSYWAAKFSVCGMYPNLEFRRRFWSRVSIPAWYRQNLVVYTRQEEFELGPLDVVHPELARARSIMALWSQIWRKA